MYVLFESKTGQIGRFEVVLLTRTRTGIKVKCANYVGKPLPFEFIGQCSNEAYELISTLRSFSLLLVVFSTKFKWHISSAKLITP